VLFLVNQGRTSTANIVMAYLYFILVVAVIWQFVLFVRKMHERGINESKRT
jgi:hypothetical protein